MPLVLTIALLVFMVVAFVVYVAAFVLSVRGDWQARRLHEKHVRHIIRLFKANPRFLQ